LPPGPDVLQAVVPSPASDSSEHKPIRKIGGPGRAVKKDKVELLRKHMAFARMTRIGWPRETGRRTCGHGREADQVLYRGRPAVDSPSCRAVAACVTRVVARRRSPAPGTCLADLRVRCHKLAGAARLEFFR